MQAIRYITLLLFFLAFSRIANAQGLVIRNYNVKDGLANATVYGAVQDAEGFIWFATPTGVSKFDGKRFRNYTKKDGLTDNDVIKLAADSRGRVWFFTNNGKPSFYSNPGVHNEENDSSLRFNSRSQYIQYAFEDQARVIWFLNSGGSVIQYNGRQTVYNKLGDAPTDVFYFLRTKKDTVFRPLQRSLSLPGVKDSNNTDQKIFLTALSPVQAPVFKERIKRQPVIITDNVLYSYTRKDIIPFFKGDDWGITEEISSICIDKDNLWIGSQRALYLIRDYFKGEKKISKLLDNHYITSILNDRDGNIWITTYGDGVYHIPFKHFYFGYFDNTNGLYSHSVYSVYKDQRNGLLYIGENAGMLNTMDKEGAIHRLTLDSTLGRNSIFGILPLQKGQEVVIGTDNGIYQYAPGYKTPRLILNMKAVKDMEMTPSGKLRVVTRGKMLSGLEFKPTDLGVLETLITSIACLSDTSYYLGTGSGLYFSNGGMPYPIQQDPRLSQSIKDLQWIDGYLWIGTSDQGIFVLKNNQIIRHFKVSDRLVSDICQQLYYDGQGRLYVATNRGVSVIDTKERVLVRNITSNDGLMSDDIRGLCHSGDTLYVATSNGLCYFSRDHIPVDTIPPTVYLNLVRYGDSSFPAYPSFTHLYERGSTFEVEFGAIAYDLPEMVEYQYNFSNDTSGGWVTTMSNIIPYPKLQPGEYKLLIRARKYKSNWSEPVSLNISILPQWYQEWWARGILVLLGLLAIILILRYIIGRIKGGEKRKTEYNRRIAELEAKALTNQMNPHFIFNSLNSVQHLILEKEEKQALNFLADFATLMRQMLNNSRKSYISLEDEIAFLARYLELEKIRFANSFVYKFEMSDELREYTVYIPPMLIQPILENAIKHGLAPKNGSGHLLVKLEMHGDLLYCAVDDDGIGWEHANNIKSGKLAKHESTALSVIRERLQIIKSFNGSVGKLEIIDKFKSGFGNKEGTLVEILIPIVKML